VGSGGLAVLLNGRRSGSAVRPHRPDANSFLDRGSLQSPVVPGIPRGAWNLKYAVMVGNEQSCPLRGVAVGQGASTYSICDDFMAYPVFKR
tara:strand:+ start:108437 stop:108709 length:273 start_codon:yes stop_codon:yes gene_type:complete